MYEKMYFVDEFFMTVIITSHNLIELAKSVISIVPFLRIYLPF